MILSAIEIGKVYTNEVAILMWYMIGGLPYYYYTTPSHWRGAINKDIL